MDKLIRLVIGAVVIAILVAITYGWTLIHVALELTGTNYIYAVSVLIVLYVAYIIGDIVLVAFKTRMEK